MLCFTYLQVMPEFIDFLMTFGRQSRARQFHRSACKSRTRLRTSRSLERQSSSASLRIPILGWSGQDLQICYNLKSMESSSQGDWPWSLRDCAVNHTFDLQITRVTWIMIKGNTLIQDRIRAAALYQSPAELSTFQTRAKAFASTLATHLLIFGWAAENWENFIDFIDEKHHEISRRAISDEIDIPPAIIRSDKSSSFQEFKQTHTDLSARSVTSGLSRIPHHTPESLTPILKKDRGSLPITDAAWDAEAKDVLPTTKKTLRVGFDSRGQQDFYFSDLQKLQFIQDKANEAILVLKLNTKVMAQIWDFYHIALPLQQVSTTGQCEEDLQVFTSRSQVLQDDLNTFVLKLETLATSIAGSKQLVSDLICHTRGRIDYPQIYGILDFRNVESNKLLARQSVLSTFNMDGMTLEMNDIARKTKTESVSMRVITLVTLCFLPGTFVSVCQRSSRFFKVLQRYPEPQARLYLLGV